MESVFGGLLLVAIKLALVEEAIEREAPITLAARFASLSGGHF